MPVETSSTNRLPEPSFSLRRRWTEKQAISYLMQQGVENPGVISLAAGLVDPGSLPVEETRQAVRELLADDRRAREVLQYGTTQGAQTLRQQLLGHLARLEGCSVEDLGIDAEQLILTTGSQQFLSLVADALIDPGDICLVAAPTYFVFLGVLNGLNACTIAVDTDENGMDPDALEAQLIRLEADGRLDRVKLIYLVSYYENPTGLCLSAARRERIVEIAKRWSKFHRLYVLEDAAYREMRYDGPVLPSVWGFDGSRESVILAQTFSKSFSPGLRVGYGVLPRDLIAPICDRKGNEDFGSANFNQHLIATVMQRGLYAPHVEKVRDSYRNKRDCMLRAIDTHFAGIEGVTWVHPHGGLYVWMTLPDHMETGFTSPLFRQAANVEGVMYVPGELCYGGEKASRPSHQMRLSFGVEEPSKLDEGTRRLANAVRAVV
ncbi:MAG: PLP-dependent aminotransferase family protein [Planctomycetaceae bacterium]